MPPMYSARIGRIALRAFSRSSPIITLTEGQIRKSSSDRLARRAPSSSGTRKALVCSGEKNTGSHPSAISPARATFLGPRTARKIGRLAMELDLLARQGEPEHRHVFAGALELPGEAHAVESLGDLGSGRAE